MLTLVPAVLGLQTVVGFNPPHKGIFAVAYSLALCLLTAIFLTIGRRAEFLLPAIDMSGTPPVARMARAAGPLLVGLLTGVASAYLAKLFGL